MESLPVVIIRILCFAFTLALDLLTLIIQNSTAVAWGLIVAYGTYKLLRWVFEFKVTIHPAAKKTFKDMVNKFQLETMWCEDDEFTSAGVGGPDADLVDNAQRENTKAVRSSRRVNYAVRVAHVAKAQVGLLASSRANELVYARLCREEMVKHGVRPSHIAHMVPLAVAACFIPLDADYLAASIRQGKGMKDRRALLGPAWDK